MKKIVLINFFILSSVLFFAFTTNNNLPVPKQPTEGFVPDEKTAIKIAEAIWLPIFGDKIYKYQPFIAILVEGKNWKVYGTVYTEKGGSPVAIIQKSDCKILKVYREK
jgi:hypothetical protein